MTTTETRTVNDACEADMRDALRGRLDHMRRVADARGRVHAFIEAFAARVGTADALVKNVPQKDADAVELWIDDLRALLDAEFTPGRDTKQDGPRDDDDEDETGLHRAQALAQHASSQGRDVQPSTRWGDGE